MIRLLSVGYELLSFNTENCWVLKTFLLVHWE